MKNSSDQVEKAKGSLRRCLDYNLKHDFRKNSYPNTKATAV